MHRNGQAIDVLIEQVNKWYLGGVHAVRDMDMEIRKGEFLVFVGPSGCGKTTLLRMIAGLESISEGTISMDGRVINKVQPKNRDIAMVFQNYALYPTMNVGDNIAFPLKMRRMEKRQRGEQVDQVARKLELLELLGRRPAALSGGQRQRVALARAMVRKPKLFLMDEPLSNLDAKLRVGMRREIVALQRELGVTTVYVTHDQTEAMTMGNRIAVMNAGVLQQIGTPREIYHTPRNLFVAGFIGSPPMNLWKGQVIREQGIEFLSFGDARVPVPSGLIPPDAKHQGLQIGIRPEHVLPARSEDPESLWMEIDGVENLGRESVVFLKSPGRPELSMITDGDFQGLPGEAIPIRFDCGRLHFFDGETGERCATGI